MWGNKKPDTDADLIVAVQELLQRARSGDHGESRRVEMIRILANKDLAFPANVASWIMKQGKHKPIIEQAIELYDVMSRLIILCEPKGEKVGPSCPVRLVNFEEKTAREILASTMHLSFLWRTEGMDRATTKAIELLKPDEKDLYFKAKACISETRPHPTLQSLAAEVLDKAAGTSVFSGETYRFVKALQGHKFIDFNYHRDNAIRAVDSFGQDRKPVSQHLQEAITAPGVSEAFAEIRKQASLAVAAMVESASDRARLSATLHEIAGRDVRAAIAPNAAEIARSVAEFFSSDVMQKTFEAVSSSVAAMHDLQRRESEDEEGKHSHLTLVPHVM